MSNADLLLRLEGVKQTSSVTYRAKCPSHGSKSRSLSIKIDGGRTLIHCFAGCEPLEILYSIGLSIEDLFDDPLQHNRPLTSEQEQRYAKQEGHKIFKAEEYLTIATGALKSGEPLTDAQIGKAHKYKQYLQSRGMISKGDNSAS